MSEISKKRANTGKTAQDVAHDLGLDIRIIYVIENYSLADIKELYTAYNDHITKLEAAASTKSKIAELEQAATLNESIGMMDAVTEIRRRISDLAGGQVDLLVNHNVNHKVKKEKNKVLAQV
jgi:hypothetical protein